MNLFFSCTLHGDPHTASNATVVVNTGTGYTIYS